MTTSLLAVDATNAAPRPLDPTPVRTTDSDRRTPGGVDQVRYLAGGVLTVGVAVLTALLGVVVARGILHLNAFGLAGPATLPYVLGVAGAALGGALLYDAMLHIAPNPKAYFMTLTALGTALAVAIPFTTGATLAAQTAVAVTNVAVGLVIAALVPLAAGNARR